MLFGWQSVRDPPLSNHGTRLHNQQRLRELASGPGVKKGVQLFCSYGPEMMR